MQGRFREPSYKGSESRVTEWGLFLCLLPRHSYPPAVQPLPKDLIESMVKTALTEDIGSGDATTLATVPASLPARAQMVAREELIVAGLPVADSVFKQVDGSLQVRLRAAEGEQVKAGASLLEVTGRARSILTAERVAINFVQRLSGIATLTARFVEAIKGTSAQILDTRKTIPGWRRFEKYAVLCGGGKNHRYDLSDLILIKDNHLAALGAESADPIATAVERARRQYPQLRVEVEADRLEQVAAAVKAGADIVLLDNMSLDDIRAAVRMVSGCCRTEASGGVSLQTVRAIAETGVDFISVGALTHSARAVDIGLDFAV